MSGSKDDDPSHALLESVQKAKRQTVATACQYCRKKRTKCDGQRPCSECVRRKLECAYVAKENETPQQAHKRKFDELTQSHDQLKDLFQTLAGQDEQRAVEIFHRIRSGHRLESLLNMVCHGSIQQTIELTYDQRLRRAFLMMVMNSTASLHEVVSVAAAVVNNKTRINLPPLESYSSLRDTIITLETLSGVLSEANPGPAIEEGPSSRPSKFARISSDGLYSGPVFWVPAEPWTTLINSDEVVSELVSFFLAFCNPCWRMVEEDVFIRDMRSRKVDSQYCSPLLVHAILAWASLYSEREEVLSKPDHYITRGEHFHNESLRLVTLEAGRECITNIQALCVLSVETGLRAQDRLGLQLVMSASAMNRTLPIPDSTSDMSVTAQTHARVRACVWWAITHLQIEYSTSLLKGKDWLPVNFEHAPDAKWPDTTVYWTGHPLLHRPKEFCPNKLYHHRMICDRLNWELVEIVLTDESRRRPVQVFWAAVHDLIRRLMKWYDSLPVQLQYTKDMPVPLYEFHASHYCTCMAIYEQTHKSVSHDSSDVDADDHDEHIEELKAHLRKKALEYAYKAASCVRDFREVYGFKATQPFLLQNAVFGSFILLNDMEYNHSRQRRGTPDSPEVDMNIDTHSGFEECFRLLVATGMQFMFPRGIARMVYQTARHLNVQLPGAVMQMIQAVAETSWHPSDVHHLRSSFPNWSILRKGNAATEDYQMADLLKKWEELEVED